MPIKSFLSPNPKLPMKLIRTLFVVTTLLTGSAHLAVAQGDADLSKTLVPEMVKKGFNTLLSSVVAAELDGMLTGAGPYTVLGPTDVAFRDLSKAQLDALLADKVKLKKVLEGHIVEGKIASTDLKSATLKTLAGTTLEVKVVDGKIKINGATVVKPDVAASNGVIHGIDKLLQQP